MGPLKKKQNFTIRKQVFLLFEALLFIVKMWLVNNNSVF